MFMSSKNFRSLIYRLLTISDFTVRTSVIFFFYFVLIDQVKNNSDLEPGQISYFILIVAFPGIIYIANVIWFLAKNWHSAKLGIYNKNYYPRNKHLVSFIAVVLFYVTSLAGFVVFNSKPSNLLIQKLKPGAIGVRAWYCKVHVDSLNMQYLDTNMRWTTVPDSVIWSEENWILKVLYKNKNQDTLIAPPAAVFDPDLRRMTISNCAAVFFPHDTVYRKSFSEFKINARISFENLFSSKEMYPGFQFIAFVDTLVGGINFPWEGDLNFSELFLQFNFSFFGYHHPWIPVLDWEPIVLSRSTKSILQKHGGFLPPLSLNTKYDLSATVYNNQVLFQGHAPKPDITTVILFESRIEGAYD